MAAEVLDISLKADISQLKAALAGMEGVGKKEASAMVGAMVREYRKAEKAATKLGKTTGQEVSKGFDKASGAAERTASLMGGTFGDISDSIIDLGGRFHELAGSIGGIGGAAVGVIGGVAALSAGFGFAAHAMMEWLDTADDLKATLEDVTGIPPLSPEHEAALAAYAEASRDADAALTAASLTLMADFAPAMTTVKHLMVGMSASMSELTGESWSLSEALSGQARSMANSGFASAAALVVIDAWVAKGAEVAGSIETMTDEMKEANAAAEEWTGGMLQSNNEATRLANLLGMDATPAVVDLDKRTKEAAASARNHAAALEAEWVAANKQQTTINELVKSFDDLVAAETEATRKQEELGAAFDQGLADVGTGFATLTEDTEAATVAVQETMTKFYAEMAAASASAVLGTIEQLADAELDVLQRQVEVRRDLFQAGQKERDAVREKVEAELEAGKITDAQAQARLDAIATEGNAARKENRSTKKEEEKAILKAFKAKQSAQIADAIIQAATNTLALIPAFAYLGLGAPAAAAGVSLGALAASVSTIKAQKPPEFPMGGVVGGNRSPDHFNVGVQPGEGILSRSGVDAAGGPEAVEQLNRGTSGAGGGTMIVQLDGRTIGAAILAAGQGGQIARDADRRAGTLPGIKGVR